VVGLHLAQKLADHDARSSPALWIGTGHSPIAGENAPPRFSSLVENADIWGLPIDAKQGRVKGPEQLTKDLAANFLPSMSADGKKPFFPCAREPGHLEEGSGERKEKPLTESPAEECMARISPDGSCL
jgi:hypothetical protein